MTRKGNYQTKITDKQVTKAIALKAKGFSLAQIIKLLRLDITTEGLRLRIIKAGVSK